MLRHSPRILRLAILLFLVSSTAYSRTVRKTPVPISTANSITQKYNPADYFAAASAGIDTIVFAHWDFEDEFGGPDAQGWTSHDLSVNPTYFHVDDFAGLGGGDFGGLVPIAGSQSLWCGVRPSPDDPANSTYPGYGDYWFQIFESVSFAVTGDVDVGFDLRADSDLVTDYTEFQYLTKSGRWQTVLGPFTQLAPGVAYVASALATVPADSLNGSIQLRFLFQSSFFANSDEDGNLNTDGAIIVDNLSVSDANGLVDFQDFEAESPGALVTADGDWAASDGAYGDYSGLFDGATIVQEDPAGSNTSNVWAFFNGSTAVSCDFPEQAVVPYGPPDGTGHSSEYIDNEVWSPWVDLELARVILSFDVYVDLPRDPLVLYKWHVRFMVDDSPTAWDDWNFLYYGDQKEWYRRSEDISSLIPPGATQVQVAIGVFDFAGVGPTGYSGNCHTTAPLVDNVTLSTFTQSFVVTNTNDSGDGSLRQAIIDAEADSLLSHIGFDIPGAGPHTITPLTMFEQLDHPVIIDGYTQPGSLPNTAGPGVAGNADLKVVIDGSVSAGTAFRAYGGYTTIRGLVIHQFLRGIILNSDENIVEGCYIGTDVSGTIDMGNTTRGILILGNNNLIGGSLPAARNVISGNDSDGIDVAGDANDIFGNLIGTNAAGSAAIGNQHGVSIGSADNNWLGSADPADRNVISGNTNSEVKVSSSSANHIIGNYIGTTIGGDARLSDADNGIWLTNTRNTYVGGTSLAEANVIAGADDNAIRIGGASNLIRGNFIGVDASGTIDLGDVGQGVLVYADSCHVEYNVIAYNGGTGITVSDGEWNTLLFNDIYENGDIGIDLGWDGVTPNDTNDWDSGPNSLLNSPVITSAIRHPGYVTVSGTLEVSDWGSAIYEFYYHVNDACDPSGFGQGQQSQSVTGASGAVPIVVKSSKTTLSESSFSLDVYWDEAVAGKTLTMLVTKAASAGAPVVQTSEFSNCMLITNSPPGTDVVVELEDQNGESPATVTFDSLGTGGTTTLETLPVGSCPSFPGVFQPTTSLCYEVGTDAAFEGDFELCIDYDDTELGGTETNLSLLHYSSISSAWEDITTSVDTVANIICGSTDHFSPFVLAYNTASGVELGLPVPVSLAMAQNYPNPFNPATTIVYDVPRGASTVSINIYDVGGAVVRRLVNGPVGAGRHEVAWDGRDNKGHRVTSGIYFFRMASGKFVQTRKMILLK